MLPPAFPEVAQAYFVGPGTLLLLATLASVAGTAQIAQGVQQERAARQQARSLEQRGAAEARRRRREARRLIARQRAAFAAAGVDPAGVGPVDLLSDTAGREELAAQLSEFPFQAEAEALKFRGRQARDAAIVSGITTILGAGLTGGGGGGGGLGAGPSASLLSGSSATQPASRSLTPVGSSPSSGVA